MNRVSNWQQTTPAGYPTMPGYQVGNNQGANTASTPAVQYDMSDFERSYTAPSADAVDRGTMTYDDVIVRTVSMLAILFVAAAATWTAATINPSVSLGLMVVGVIGGLVMAMVNIFTTATGLKVSLYSAFEGLALGGLSAVMEMRYPGIVVQALIGTFAIFGVTLALFASGRVRNSSKLQKFVLMSLFGLLAYRLLTALLTWFGVLTVNINAIEIVPGIQLGALVGVGAVLIGALSLIGDFDHIKVGVESGAPRQMAWVGVFGLLVTIVWMYTEILRLLSYFRD